ncbi:MAG: alpha/beta hydrolase [Propionicimonas sp.]
MPALANPASEPAPSGVRGPAPSTAAPELDRAADAAVLEPDPAPVTFVATPVGELAIRRTPFRGMGTPEPAILIHGLGGNATNWTDLAHALSDRLDCVAVDLPGFGFSPPPPDGDFSLAGHLRAVVAVMDELFPGRAVHVFGNSMGGAVAVQLAGRRPELTRTLCLVSPALPDLKPRRTNIHIPVMALPRVGDFMFDRYSTVGPERRVQATFDLCYADPRRLTPARRAWAEEEARRRDGLPYIREAFVGSVQGLIASYLDRGPQRPWKLAEAVEAPVLLVYGLRDKLVDAKAAHRATEAFRRALVMVIPDSGHVSMMEHPEFLDRWWREFLGVR